MFRVKSKKTSSVEHPPTDHFISKGGIKYRDIILSQEFVYGGVGPVGFQQIVTKNNSVNYDVDSSSFNITIPGNYRFEAHLKINVDSLHSAFGKSILSILHNKTPIGVGAVTMVNVSQGNNTYEDSIRVIGFGYFDSGKITVILANHLGKLSVDNNGSFFSGSLI